MRMIGVARSIKGNLLRPRLDLFTPFRSGLTELFLHPADVDSLELFRKGAVIPVYSCWNGLIIFDALPFYSPPSPSSISREGEIGYGRGEGVRFRSARGRGECEASECKLVAKDFWTLHLGRYIVRLPLPLSPNEISLTEGGGRWSLVLESRTRRKVIIIPI